MAKVVVLVPRAEMLEQAEKMSSKYKLDILYMKEANTLEIESIAETAVETGAEIIIARGVHATLIKRRLKIPVVEILITGQEMGQLIVKAKTLVEKPLPKISIVGFANMYCDMSSFNKLYDVNLCEYFVEQSEQLVHAVEQAVYENADVIIGGDIVCQHAAYQGVPSLFLMSGNESIAEAFRNAEKVSYAIDLEKKNTAEFRTLLDYSFYGIIKIASDGNVLHANHLAEKLLDREESEIIGRNLSKLIPQITIPMLDSVLVDGQEIYSMSFEIKKTLVIFNIAPIMFEHTTQGAIISFHEGQKVAEMEAEIRREQNKKGYKARHTFETFVAQTPQTKALVEKAKTYAKFNAPILLLANDSTEKEMLAQCIHNHSINKNNPFVFVTCGSINKSETERLLFGNDDISEINYTKGLLDWAKGGTIFLDEISLLDYSAQSKLYELIKIQHRGYSNESIFTASNVRIIASDSTQLLRLVEQGKFRRDLFCALNVLPLTMTPLQERREDIRGWIDSFIAEFEKKHQRYIHLTAEAHKLLMDYKWSGNIPELYSFCERLVILSPRRMVNENVILSFMNIGMMPENKYLKQETNPTYIQKDKEAKTRDALEKHDGNRKLAANEIGVSLTTLWRYIKKYNIED